MRTTKPIAIIAVIWGIAIWGAPGCSTSRTVPYSYQVVADCAITSCARWIHPPTPVDPAPGDIPSATTISHVQGLVLERPGTEAASATVLRSMDRLTIELSEIQSKPWGVFSTIDVTPHGSDRSKIDIISHSSSHESAVKSLLGMRDKAHEKMILNEIEAALASMR